MKSFNGILGTFFTFYTKPADPVLAAEFVYFVKNVPFLQADIIRPLFEASHAIPAKRPAAIRRKPLPLNPGTQFFFAREFV